MTGSSSGCAPRRSSVFPTLPAAPSRCSPIIVPQVRCQHGGLNAESSSAHGSRAMAVTHGLEIFAWQATALVWSALAPTSLKGGIAYRQRFPFCLFCSFYRAFRCVFYSSCCLHARAQATAEIAYGQAAEAMPGLMPAATSLWTSDIAPPSKRWIRKVLGPDVTILSDVMLGRRFRFRFLIINEFIFSTAP